MSQPQHRTFVRNLATIIASMAVLGAQSPMLVIVGGLAGRAMLPDDAKLLATLPITAMMMASWLMAMPMSLFMGRFGRRAGFLVASMMGMTGGLIGALAAVHNIFPLLVLAGACTGVYLSGQNYFRFAAADTAPAPMRPKAISWAMAAGLVSALTGPELVQQAGYLFPGNIFLGAFIAIIGINAVGMMVVSLIEIPPPPRGRDKAHGGRTLREIFHQKRALTAIVSAMVSFSLMTLVMTATPLVMEDYGFSKHRIADVVRWHVFSMFAPSFVTGSLIVRFGYRRIIGTGLAVLALSGMVGFVGQSLVNFYLCLILLGLGWNFGYVGSTALLTDCHRPEEQSRVQGFNDFCVFGLVSLASLASGALAWFGGWYAVLLAMVAPILIAGLVLIWGLSEPRPVRKQADDIEDRQQQSIALGPDQSPGAS